MSGSASPERALRDGAVRGKHAVLVPGGGARAADRAVFPLVMAIRNAGAASVLVASTWDDAAWTATAAGALEPTLDKAWGAVPRAVEAFRPLPRIRASSLETLLRGTGIDLAALRTRSSGPVRVDAVPGRTPTLTQRLDTRSIDAPNVVGILDGSDPAVRDEYVVLSAHMDHVGMGSADEAGDSIFNGADDDASGTAAVMEVAEAMASLPAAPGRSMIFLLVSGEERGLWGSEYYAEHPELGMTAIDDLWPEERFYFRSDHYNFARGGVPILFFFNGTHDDYHGPDDEPERIDAEKASRIAKLLFYLGIDVGNAARRPEWNPESYERIVSDGVG